jgi:hypothetical protein
VVHSFFIHKPVEKPCQIYLTSDGCVSGMTRDREGKEKENQAPDDCCISTILMWPWCFAKLILLSATKRFDTNLNLLSR